MTVQQRKTLYQKAIDTWGDRAQLEMAQEEATELALAIRRLIRGKENAITELVSEIADVEIMIEQIKFMNPHCVMAIEDEKDFKLNRLNDRLNEHDNNF